MTSEILLTVAAVAGINGVLALLLVTAERFLANYGRVKVVINDEKTLEVDGGSSLLSTLNSQKIFLPSACGGRGTCGYCKCKITDGAGPLLPTESPLLTDEEIAAETRIACQIKVKRDLAITIPEELFNIREFKAAVAEISDLTYDIKRVRLELKDPPEIRFKAGQYVQLRSKPYPGVRESVSRAYSIASPATQKHEIDLLIRLVPDGICTTWVHKYLKKNETVTFTGPMGDFGLHGENEEMVIIAGGSGMAPMVPILKKLADMKSKRKITYFFGANTPADLFYTDEIRAFESSLPNFTYVPTLADPEGTDWKGATGLITVPLEEHLKSVDGPSTQGYLCGSPGMINACIRLMEKYGISREQVFFDPFA